MMLVQIGTLTRLDREALLPCARSKPWLLQHGRERTAEAAELGEGVALQYLRQQPAKVWLYEAVPSPYFAELKRLLAASGGHYGEQFFNARDCFKQLTAWVEQTHRRFALLAQAGADDIYRYNAEAARPEPLIYVLLSGLHAELAEANVLEALQTLCLRGPQVGIVPLLLHDVDAPSSTLLADTRKQAVRDFWAQLGEQAVGLALTDNGAVRPLGIPAQPWSLLQRFGLRLGLATVAKTTANALLDARQQAGSSGGLQDFLHVPIGMIGATPAHFSMGEHSDVYHALIGGATRSGKTTLLNNVILSACERYAPDELQLSLLDFKDGVSFWEYEGLAHVVQLYADPDASFADALACLERFAGEIGARNRLLIEQRVQTLADYNRLPGKRMPRHVLIIDEAQSLFEGRDYKQKTAVKQMLSAVAKKGAAVGLHMVLCTQSYQNVELEGDVKEQFHLRIGFRHATGIGCRALMGRDNEAMLSLEWFTAIYNDRQGETRHNRVVALDAMLDFLPRLDALKAKFPVILNAGEWSGQGARTGSSAKALSEEGRFTAGDVGEPWD